MVLRVAPGEQCSLQCQPTGCDTVGSHHPHSKPDTDLPYSWLCALGSPESVPMHSVVCDPVSCYGLLSTSLLFTVSCTWFESLHMQTLAAFVRLSGVPCLNAHALADDRTCTLDTTPGSIRTKPEQHVQELPSTREDTKQETHVATLLPPANV